MADEEMTPAEQVAGWMEEAPHQTIYEEAGEFRKILLAGFGETKPKWEQLTPEAVAEVVNTWIARPRLGTSLPQLEGAQKATTGEVTAGWLRRLEAKAKTPALVAVDDYTGVLHALHCSLRGLDPYAEEKEQAERQKNAPKMRSDFNLRG